MASWQGVDGGNKSLTRTGTPMSCSALSDSFVANHDWDTILGAACRATIEADGVAGDELSDANTVGTSLESRQAAAMVGCQHVVVQGGINDIRVAASDTSVTNMQTSAATMLAAAIAAGVTISFCTTTPFGGHANYTETREGYRTTWNAWLIAWCATNGIKCHDIAAAVQDPEDSTVWATGLGDPDLLHPLDTAGGGSEVIAYTILSDLYYLLDQDA